MHGMWMWRECSCKALTRAISCRFATRSLCSHRCTLSIRSSFASSLYVLFLFFRMVYKFRSNCLVVNWSRLRSEWRSCEQTIVKISKSSPIATTRYWCNVKQTPCLMITVSVVAYLISLSTNQPTIIILLDLRPRTPSSMPPPLTPLHPSSTSATTAAAAVAIA